MAKKHYKQPNKKSLGKTLLIVLLSVLGVVAVALDIWCGYIHFFGKEKVANTTVNIGDMTVTSTDSVTGETVTETKTFLEVNAFDNAIEIKFNDLQDESQTKFFSQGIQIMVKDNSKLDLRSKNVFDGSFSKTIKTKTVRTEDYKYKFLTWYDYVEQSIVLTDRIYKNVDLFEYQSADNFETPLSSDLILSGDEFFKLQAQDGDKTKIIGLKFKDYNVTYKNGIPTKDLDVSKMTRVGSHSYTQSDINALIYNKKTDYKDVYYRAYDIYYLIEYISNAVQGLGKGYIGETYIKMPDIFTFYDGNENGEYKNIMPKDDAFMNIESRGLLFSKIKITVNEGDLVSSTQSMFNKIRNYQNYTTDENYIDKTDYLTGRSLITATLDDLEWIETEDAGVYTFALSEDFKKKWIKFKYSAFIKVVIDSEYLEDCGITYQDFDLTSAGDFTIYNIKTTTGDTLYEGVQYA